MISAPFYPGADKEVAVLRRGPVTYSPASLIGRLADHHELKKRLPFNLPLCNLQMTRSSDGQIPVTHFPASVIGWFAAQREPEIRLRFGNQQMTQ